MSNLKWKESNLSNLGRPFLQAVLNNMRNKEGTVVRFGETGEGKQPNYQVTYPNGVSRTIRGSSHDSFDDANLFNEGHISEPFGLEAIKRAYYA